MATMTAEDKRMGPIRRNEDGLIYDNLYLAPGYTIECENLVITGSLIFGDASVDSFNLKGRMTTMTDAGANIELGATYDHGELWEIRSKVTSWTGIGDSFKGYYFRAETGVASGGKGLRAAEFYAVANATFSIDNLQGAYFEAAMKASGTQTIKNANAAEFALAPYGGTGAITITNHWECVLLTPSGVSSRIDSGNAAKIHGIYLLARDGDGGSTKLGDGFYMGNDGDQAGTRTLTNGINIAIGCTDGIIISGATTRGLNISNSVSQAIKIATTTGVGVQVDMSAATGGTLKLHCHQAAAGVEYANEFKGEFLSTSGTMDGIAAHYHMAASGTGVMRSILGVAYLDTGVTLSGTSAAASWISGILGSVNVEGTINGTAVTVTGVYGGLGSMTGGTLTACKYMSAIWADSQVTQVPSSGESQLLLMTNGLGATLNQAIYIDANDRISEFAHFANCATMISTKTDADVAYAHYRKLLVTVDGLPGWIYIEMAA